MTFSRLYGISLVCAGIALAACPGYAKGPAKTVSLPPANNFIFPQITVKNKTYNQLRPWTPEKSATTDARMKAEATTKKASTKKPSTTWTSKYKLYVNCPTEPSDVNFSSIQAAVDFALEYTTIQVCYGSYTGDIVVFTDHVKLLGQGDHSGDQQILDPSGPPYSMYGGYDGSWGVVLLGNYDDVQNLTFTDLTYGVGTSIFIENTGNVVNHNWFEDDGLGVGSILGTGTVVENNTMNNNIYPFIALAGTDETISCNTVAGDENPSTFDNDGIAVYDSVGDTITGNKVSSTAWGLDFEFANSMATVTSNHFDGNFIGIAIVEDNSGNTFSKNQVNGNYEAGIASDFSSGLDAFPTEGVNKFVSNTTLGNGTFYGACSFTGFGCDIYDETAGYIGFTEGNNDDTADYYSKNTGDLYSSYPINIYQQ